MVNERRCVKIGEFGRCRKRFLPFPSNLAIHLRATIKRCHHRRLRPTSLNIRAAITNQHALITKLVKPRGTVDNRSVDTARSHAMDTPLPLVT